MAESTINALAHDVRSAVRSLWRAPRFSALIVLSLALGIGANAALFSVVRSVVFKPVPYQDADRVAFVSLYWRDTPIRMTERQAADIQRLARSVERVEASSTERLDWRRGDSTVRLLGRRVTPELPTAMGMIPLAGRGFVAEDGSSWSEPVVVISEGLWRRELGSAPDILGTTLVLGDVGHTIVGVSRAPVSERDVDVWMPRRFDPTGDWQPRVIIAWLRPEVSVEEAKREIESLAAALDPDGFARLEARLTQPGEQGRGSPINRTLLLLWVTSAFVLAIVCANLASLLLARNAARQREIGIRGALGASRASIVRGLLAESLLLGALGGLGSVFFAMWGTTALLALRPRSLSLVYPDHVPVDATLVAYSLGLSLLAGLIVGLVPALRAAGVDILSSIRRSDPSDESAFFGRWLFRGAVGLQTALALVLLVGAGLMIGSLFRLYGVGPGFDPDPVVEMVVELDPAVHVDPGGRRDFFHRLAEAVGRLEGVAEASVAADAPPHGTVAVGQIQLEGRSSESFVTADSSWAYVAPNYFRVLRIPQVEGQALTDQEVGDGQVVVSQSFARKFWPHASAVGQRFRLARRDGWGPWMRVVGVVGDVTGRGLRDTSDEIYVPYATYGAERGVILARVDGEPSRLFQVMKEQVWALDPDVPISRISTLRDGLATSVDEELFYAKLLGLFACIALALAAVGVFGVASYAASRRTHEIGIRIALGARASDVERLVVMQGLVPSLLGIAAGLAGAYALAQVMSSLVYEVSVTDVGTYLSTALTLAAVSLIATWVPARRASRVDAMRVLRSE